MSKMRPMAGGKEAAMNAASKEQPKSGHTSPAGPKGNSPRSAVGNETKADVKGAQGGMPSDGLKGAMTELQRQHPERWDDIGPHNSRR